MNPLQLKIERLSRSFQNRRVFESESLRFEGPGLLLLRGDNGSGKTTLLRLLSGLILPDSGDAWLCGHSLCREPELARKSVGYLPSTENTFFPRLNGAENLTFFGLARGLTQIEINARLAKLQQHLKLDSVLHTPYLASSSGMKQTLALARALLCDPEILLLDEPTRNLDRNAAESFRSYLAELARTKLVVLATHIDADMAHANASWILRDAKLQEEKR